MNQVSGFAAGASARKSYEKAWITCRSYISGTAIFHRDSNSGDQILDSIGADAAKAARISPVERCSRFFRRNARRFSPGNVPNIFLLRAYKVMSAFFSVSHLAFCRVYRSLSCTYTHMRANSITAFDFRERNIARHPLSELFFLIRIPWQ